MRYFILLSGIFSMNLISVVSAQTTVQCNRALKNIMEDMRLEYRYIGKNFRNTSLAANVIASNERFYSYVTEAMSCAPNNLSSAEAQQFQGLLEKVLEEIQKMKVAIPEQRYDDMQVCIQQIHTLMKEGHRIFD